MIDHEQRRKTLGASEVAAILELNENMTPLDVWQVKTGRSLPFEGNAHTRRGNRQEAQILEWLAEDLGISSYARSDSSISGKCPLSEIATATPDGFVFVNGAIECCEAKSTLKRIKTEEDIPITFLVQCQWQMLCTGLKKCHLAIFGPMVSDYQRFEIAWNEAFAMELLAQATEWWEKHVIGDLQPDPINVKDTLFLYPNDNGLSIEAVPVLAEAIGQYADLKAQIRDLESSVDELKNRIVRAIGPNEAVFFGGRRIASYKTMTKASYTVKASTTRVLRV